MDGQLNSVECNNEGGKNKKELYFDSGIGAEKISSPWWRTADTDELASFVAHMSLELVENCDLPRPRVKKYTDFNISARKHTPERSAEGHLVPTANRSLRYIDPVHKLMYNMHSLDNNMTKAQLLEALRHSQTRARLAEKVANQARADKERIVKLLFIQASHLFAYKQWLQLVQLENVYMQFVNNKSRSVSIIFPVVSPQTTKEEMPVSIVFPVISPQTTKENHKSQQEGSCRKNRGKHCSHYEFGKYNVVFALGLGLAGAGFLLGWTIGWILPTW